MRAIIAKDGSIVKYTINENKGVEVGTPPSGVGLERLRWNGYELIDIATLDEFWVEPDCFKLHAKYHPGAQLVKMNYSDKRKLKLDGETIRIKTKDEILQPKRDEYKSRRSNEYPNIGDQMDTLWKFISTLSNLPQDVQDILIEINKVKERWPKPNDARVEEL